MTHILIIVENLPVPLDYRVWLIAQTLRDNGYMVSIISPATDKYPKGEFLIDDIKVYRHYLPEAKGSLFNYLWEYSVALWNEFRLSIKIFTKNRFHVIHACNPPDLIWLIALLWKTFGVKFVYDHHDLAPEILMAKLNCRNPRKMSVVHRFAYKMLKLNEYISHKTANAVLATNESFRKIALERNKCNKEKVFVVRTGPGISELHENIANPDIVDNIPKIAYVGIMAKQDGVDSLLRSIHYIISKLDRQVQVILIGSGPQVDALKNLSLKLGIQEAVSFCGFVPRENMMEKLADCTIGVTPDPSGPMNDVSTMLKVLDYMCCGLPQVMYDLPENRATADEGALYALPSDEKDFSEKIVELIDNPHLRVLLGERGRERVELLAWQNCGAPDLIKAYKFIK